MLFVEADGTVGERRVSWTPPSPSQPSDETLPHVDLSIYYDKATKDGLGTPTLVMIESDARPGTPEFAAKRVDWTTNGGRAWTAKFGEPSMDGDFQEQVIRFAADDGQAPPTNVNLLAGLGSTGRADIGLRDQAGKLISQVRFDLSKKRKACLIDAVRSAVEAASKDPASAARLCAPMDGEPPDIYYAFKHTAC